MRTRINSSGNPASSEDVGHVTVLLHEAVDMLGIQPGDTVVDGTLGGAGHAQRMAARLGAQGTFVGFDLDDAALGRARRALAKSHCAVRLVRENFRDIAPALSHLGITRVNRALFDLGWSSYQLNDGRGFSFLVDEPLHMTYASDPSTAFLTAERIINDWEESSIADVIYGWGGERYSRRIARAIVEAREHRRITRSGELAEIVMAAVPAAYRHGKTHPATKTFQALRIAVNDELGALDDALQSMRTLLSPGGRVAFITFHSLEDRAVKQAFAAWEKAGEGIRVTKKPIPPSKDEVRVNPRARSAKLRVFEKCYE